MYWGQGRKEAILRSRLRGAEEYIKQHGERVRVTCQQLLQTAIANQYTKEGCTKGFVLTGPARELEIFLFDQVLRLSFKEIQHLRPTISPQEILEARKSVDEKIKQMDAQAVAAFEELFQGLTEIKNDYLREVEKDRMK